jgi:hypothetical protein
MPRSSTRTFGRDRTGEARAWRRKCSLVELGVCVLALVGVSVAVFGSHIVDGGFYYDDWSHASTYRFDGFYRAALDFWHHVIPGRPILAFLLPVPHATFGFRPELHLALAVALGVLASATFFVFLRELRVEAGHALAMASLALVVPWSDATRLWPTASINNVAVTAYFLGVVAALRALRACGRPALFLHIIASILFLVSVLTYEVAAAAIALGGLLYRGQSRRRRVALRWFADVTLMVVPLAVSLAVTTRVRHVGSLSDRAADVLPFARDSFAMLASAYLPQRFDSTGARLIVLVVVAGVVAWAFLHARRPSADALRRWLARATTAAVGVSSAYVMFLGSGLRPLFAGVDNRINTFAGFAFVVLVYSLVAMAALLIAGRPGRTATLVLALALVLVGSGFIARVRDDVRHFDEATALQADALARLGRALPAPEPGTMILTFGYPAETAPGIPIFWHSWDMSGAVSLTWDDPSLSAVPVYRTSVVCGRQSLYPGELKAEPHGRYGRVVFVDLGSGRTKRIGSQPECYDARRVFRPGPLVKSR